MKESEPPDEREGRRRDWAVDLTDVSIDSDSVDAEIDDPRDHFYGHLCRTLVKKIRATALSAKEASLAVEAISNLCDDPFLYRLTRYYAFEAMRVYEAALFDAALYERLQCSNGLSVLLRTIKTIRRVAADAREAACRGSQF